MNNIITGGTGLVGSRLIFDLVSKQEKVSVIKRKETPLDKLLSALSYYSKTPNEIVNKIDIIEGNISDFEFLLNIIPAGSNIYHAAAKVSFAKKDQQEIFETNVVGTQNIVYASLEKKVNKLCFISSIASLGGKINGQKINENTPWSSNGKSPYSLSKYEAEMEVWKGIAEGLNAVIVNPGIILGPGDWNQGSSQLFSTVANGLKYYTKGITAYVDVRDVTKAMFQLMESDVSGERFILAAENLSYENLFSEIATMLGVKKPNFYATPFLTGTGWILSKLISVLSQNQPKLTKHTHNAAHKKNIYDGNKIKEFVNFNYTPINETIEFVAKMYLSNH